MNEANHVEVEATAEFAAESERDMVSLLINPWLLQLALRVDLSSSCLCHSQLFYIIWPLAQHIPRLSVFWTTRSENQQ